MFHRFPEQAFPRGLCHPFFRYFLQRQEAPLDFGIVTDLVVEKGPACIAACGVSACIAAIQALKGAFEGFLGYGVLFLVSRQFDG
ncbi:MAG: hypothetical protein A2Y73_02020 [Chloroflexi bacterium RBG_13_56_8]|nr:MAG: hypothetical protein A2Y73_02020 [Chloroflexi bacterium RBG_13_56_8]